MYYLGSVLQEGYSAHTVMQQAFNRTEEAMDALDMSESSENTSDAAIIGNLLQGETAAQNRTIYHANSAISMMQTFREGARTIANTLAGMSTIAARAATGVYSSLEVEAMQDQFNDLGIRVNRTAKKTRYGPYRLLDKDEQNVSFALGTGFSVSLDRKDLGIDTEPLSLERDAKGVIVRLNQFVAEATAYGNHLDEVRAVMQQQVAMAEYDISQAMGYSMHIPNAEFAKGVVKEAVAAVTADNKVALQAQAKPSSMTLMLARDNLAKPYRWST
ncbi:MAG: hypothetical protein IH892_01350 [Planctomycetes bacterium]|nr:hypothetical protein [Planctomycetota bacterium]